VATGFGIATSSGDKTITDGFDASAGTYKATRQDALGVQRNALATNISFGVAGAMGVATVIFLILDLTSGTSPVQVAPAVGPSTAGVSVGGHF
jgi:hypothetical protein